MESIRILQDIFERLYAVAIPMRDFLEDELPHVSKNWWYDCVESSLSHDSNYLYTDSSKDNLDDVDIYFLTKILLKYWEALRQKSPNSGLYTREHKENFRKLQELRNKIAHPEHRHYTDTEYWQAIKTIDTAAHFFGYSIKDLLHEIHQQEKAKILGIIQQKVLAPAIACETLDPDIKKSVVDTLDRLQKKSTAREIVDFFNDALDAKRGKVVYAALKSNGLTGFEDIKSLVLDCYYGFE